MLNQMKPRYHSHWFPPSSHSVFKLSTIRVHLEFSSSRQVLSAILWDGGGEIEIEQQIDLKHLVVLFYSFCTKSANNTFWKIW